MSIDYKKTSRAAWRSFIPVSAKLDRAILAEIEVSGDDGVTCCDIESSIGRSHQAVSGNLRHLVERGFVEQSGLYGLTPSDRSAIRWRLVRNSKPEDVSFKEDLFA
jgi:hypothetical protein